MIALVSFETIGDALWAKEALEKRGIASAAIPAPHSLGVGCNYVLSVETADVNLLADTLKIAKIDYKNVFAAGENGVN
jgi:hypothetical protein